MKEIRKMAEEWKIWNNEEEVGRSEKKTKNLLQKRFHK